MPSLTLAAHAKLNLDLFVGEAQPPKGYHPIRSWFVPVELHDTLHVERLPDGAASRIDMVWATDAPRPTPIDWPVEKDLTARAHLLLERASGRRLPVHLRVEKRIPVGGGLGGGSSDAAAALVAVNTLFELGHTTKHLREISSALGSDVAFFLDEQVPPRPAIVSGLGETVERASRVAGAVVLIFPPFGCPTAAVYQAFDRDPLHRPSDAARVDAHIQQSAESGEIPQRELFNDLTAAAVAAAPPLGQLLTDLNGRASRLTRRGGPAEPLRVHVTGSGSTMFCIPPAGVSTAEVIGALRPAAAGCVLVASRMV